MTTKAKQKERNYRKKLLANEIRNNQRPEHKWMEIKEKKN